MRREKSRIFHTRISTRKREFPTKSLTQPSLTCNCVFIYILRCTEILVDNGWKQKSVTYSMGCSHSLPWSKRPGNEDEHSSPFIVEFKNTKSFTALAPHIFIKQYPVGRSVSFGFPVSQNKNRYSGAPGISNRLLDCNEDS
jgi:hypothetical protein